MLCDDDAIRGIESEAGSLPGFLRCVEGLEYAIDDVIRRPVLSLQSRVPGTQYSALITQTRDFGFQHPGLSTRASDRGTRAWVGIDPNSHIPTYMRLIAYIRFILTTLMGFMTVYIAQIINDAAN